MVAQDQLAAGRSATVSGRISPSDFVSPAETPPTPQKTKPNSGKLAEAVYCVVNFCRADECTTKSDNPTITSNGGDGDLFVCLFFFSSG